MYILPSDTKLSAMGVALDPSPPAPPRDFEDIVDSLGSFGHWQRVIFVLISLADIFGAFAMLLPVFTGATPGWRCDTYQEQGGGGILNSSELTNDSWNTCSLSDGKYTCTEREYVDDITTIVSQVRHAL